VPVQIPLADLLSHITDQLVLADTAARARGKATMQFEECELEFAVKIEGDAKAGIKVWVLELGGGVKKSDSNTIRVKFKSIPGQPIQAAHTATTAPGPSLERRGQPKKKR
jgi:Trypsin-co-occurring domain 2